MSKKSYPCLVVTDNYLLPKMKKEFSFKKKESLEILKKTEKHLVLLYRDQIKSILCEIVRKETDKVVLKGISFVEVLDKNKNLVQVEEIKEEYELALGEKLQGDLLKQSIVDLLIHEKSEELSPQQILDLRSIDSLFDFFNETVSKLNLSPELEKKFFNEKNIIKKLKTLQESLEKKNDSLPRLFEFHPFFSPRNNPYEEKLMNKKFTSEVKEELLKEAKKLDRLPQESQESFVIKQYLDFVLSLPWGNLKEGALDLKEIEKKFHLSHYGLDEVKERILDYLFSYSLKLQSPILCLVGPYGVGKTTFVQNLAEAIDRPFEKISLAGLSDEAEIRGHRKTYVGSMPGRILSLLKKVQVDNPVILLDEVDKVAKQTRGDVYGALLELLDPSQQSQFRDHFLGLDYDLSKVLFVCTANHIEDIPRALKDRMEFIYLEGFSLEEKKIIAQNYLLPKIRKEYKLKDFEFSPKLIEKIILNLDQESGVRQLEKFLRSFTERQIRKNFLGPFEEQDLLPFLKKKDLPLLDRYPGSFDLLAYTPYGGVLIPLEVLLIDGMKMELTGEIGETFKESIKVAYSLVKRSLKSLGLVENFFDQKSFHIHVPLILGEKQGPSGGLPLYVAMISSLMNKSLPQDLVMSAELSLQGQILPVGGIKEKLLAAQRAGKKRVFLSVHNQKDIPLNLDLEVYFFHSIQEVLSLLFFEERELQVI